MSNIQVIINHLHAIHSHCQYERFDIKTDIIIENDCFNNIIYFLITDISSKSLLCSEFLGTCAILYVNRGNTELNQHSNVNVASSRVSLFLSIGKSHVPFIIDTILTLSIQIIPVPFNFLFSLVIQ